MYHPHCYSVSLKQLQCSTHTATMFHPYSYSVPHTATVFHPYSYKCSTHTATVFYPHSYSVLHTATVFHQCSYSVPHIQLSVPPILATVYHQLPLSFQTDSNKLELKTSSRISQESLVVSNKGQSLALFFL